MSKKIKKLLIDNKKEKLKIVKDSKNKGKYKIILSEIDEKDLSKIIFRLNMEWLLLNN